MSDNNYSQLSAYTWVKSVTITPSNSTVLACSGLLIEVAGSVVVEYDDGSTDTINVPNFTTLTGSFLKVRTGTTALGIHALY